MLGEDILLVHPDLAEARLVYARVAVEAIIFPGFSVCPKSIVGIQEKEVQFRTPGTLYSHTFICLSNNHAIGD